MTRTAMSAWTTSATGPTREHDLLSGGSEDMVRWCGIWDDSKQRER